MERGREGASLSEGGPTSKAEGVSAESLAADSEGVAVAASVVEFCPTAQALLRLFTLRRMNCFDTVSYNRNSLRLFPLYPSACDSAQTKVPPSPPPPLPQPPLPPPAAEAEAKTESETESRPRPPPSMAAQPRQRPPP